MAIDKVSLNSFGIKQRQQHQQSAQPNFTGSPILQRLQIILHRQRPSGIWSL